MTRLLRRLATMLALLGAVAMVFAPVAYAAHRANVRHVRCVEHGELIELTQAAAPHVAHHTPVAVSGSAAGHASHCSLDKGLAAGIAQHSLTVLPDVHGTDRSVFLLPTAPRGPPPLRYAPKTSPPSCA